MIQGFKYRAIGQSDKDGRFRDMESLINDELYASRFDQLNDPFEAIATKSFGEAIQFLKEVGLENYKPIHEISHKIISFRERAGVYSLSKSDSGIPDNELMWAHYAESHKGFCIEYDVEQLALSEELWFNVNRVDSVVYTKTLPDMSLSDIFGESDVPLITKIYGTKSMVWNYENEARLLYETSGIKRYNPAALKSVYFGLNMDKAHEDYLIDRLKNRNVKFFKMRMADGEYKLLADSVAENEREYRYKLQDDSFEIIMTNHNTAVENFHLYYKEKDRTKEAMSAFIRAFRERLCTRKANVSLYDINNEYIKKLIITYPLQGDDLSYMRKHFLAMSIFDMEDDLWMNLYD